MKILMLGWEYAPYNTGGLGVVCKELSEAMAKKGHQITFICPRNIQTNEFVTIRVAQKGENENIDMKKVDSWIIPYLDRDQLVNKYSDFEKSELVKTSNMTLFLTEMIAYQRKAMQIASEVEFDIVYAHDWMTYKAGSEIASKFKKPLVVHSHSLEWERTGGREGSDIETVEQYGFLMSDAIIAVSQYEKDLILKRYDSIFEHKVKVVHNASDFVPNTTKKSLINKNDITGLEEEITDEFDYITFVGRFSHQKGIKYLVESFWKLTKDGSYPKLKLLMVGDGYTRHQVTEQILDYGIEDKVIFLGTRQGEELVTAYKMSKMLVIPSFSEPFGLIALEAIKCGIPIILSESSGVKEILTNVPTFEHFDIEKLKELMEKVYTDKKYAKEIVSKSKEDMKVLSWDKSADKVISVLESALMNHHPIN